MQKEETDAIKKFSQLDMPTPPPNQGYAEPAKPMVTDPVAAAVVRAAAIAASPSSYELRTLPRSVVDQQKLPCCVATAIGSAMESLHASWPSLAPLFLYYITRFTNRGSDPAGYLYLLDALETLATDGICTFALHQAEYTQPGMTTPPSSPAIADGLKRAIDSFKGNVNQVDEISKVNWIKKQLRLNYPVVIGFLLPLDYNAAPSNAGYAWMDPQKPPSSASGHCILIFGFDDIRGAFHVQDSQGPEKFNKGCWWLGYRVVDSNVVSEAFSISL